MDKVIKFLRQYQADIVLALAVMLISVTAFNLGKLSANSNKKFPITIQEPDMVKSLGVVENGNNLGSKKLAPSIYNLAPSSVVASKLSKSKVYHFPWCSGASRIAERNKLEFPTEAAALAAGYILAGNCTRY